MKIEIRSIKELAKAVLITILCSIVFSNFLVYLFESFLFPPLTISDIIVTTLISGIASAIAAAVIFYQNLQTFKIKESAEKLNKELLETQKELKRQVVTDSLTNLFNRRWIFQAIQKEISRFERSRRPFSLLLIDIDHFKEVNDTFGHSTGDEVLRYFADAIKKTAREQDMIARTGGEEFCVLLPDTKKEEAKIVAERIRESVSKVPMQIGGLKISISVSIGVSEIQAQENVDCVYNRADVALYRAKEHGRNTTEMF